MLAAASAAPNAQLRALNPHVGSALRGDGARQAHTFPVQLALAPRADGLLAGGVSSFGYSGTIAHAVLRVSAQLSGRRARAPPLALARRAISWMHRAHPFAALHVPCPADDIIAVLECFCSAANSALHALVVDHVVRGRVVFPGAAYLEMARAAWRAASPAERCSGIMRLHGVLFVRPFALDARGQHLEIALRADGDFEVRSGEACASSLLDVTTHCIGKAASADITDVANVAQLLSCTARSMHCARPLDVCALYAGFDALGLQYGPAYRMLARVWPAVPSIATAVVPAVAAGRLHARRARQRTSVHPADLDGALQLSAALAPSSGRATSETRLPFAVNEAVVRSGLGVQWAVRAADTPSHPLVSAALGVRLKFACAGAQLLLRALKKAPSKRGCDPDLRG